MICCQDGCFMVRRRPWKRDTKGGLTYWPNTLIHDTWRAYQRISIDGRESIGGTCPAGIMFRETLLHQRTSLRDFSAIFPGNTESDKPDLCE